ncbi:hypothetical protein [Roseivirga echinicomitans]|uniref:Uncharacterized protein n=1 Tax=Roseivirga echinicomitans TaxID=296218 RepID=A0A150XXL2_9BACT|nr:hypothetical protein [Roseivirga echinicomitans]KYG83507.1 hypothetical protein AWN68_01505 [Roseivirga echinicomitans]
MKLKNLVFLLSLLLFGCSVGKKSEPIRTGTYFDLVELLDEQIAAFEEERPTLTKELSVNGETDQVIVQFDSAKQWKEELGLFYQADINKLGLETSYVTEELSTGTDIKKVIDSAKTDRPSVRSIEYNYRADRLESIRIIMKDENPVYKFEKELSLYFNVVQGKSVLSSFTISGDQSMILKDELNYSLKAKIGK